jgi:hypothetical protein
MAECPITPPNAMPVGTPPNAMPVVAFTDTAAADAKRWSVPPMVLADLRPAAVQVFQLQTALEPRIAKVEEGLHQQTAAAAVDRAAVTAANAANAALIGGLLHAQATEAKAQRDALERRFEELMRAQATAFAETIAALRADGDARAAIGTRNRCPAR